MVKMFDLSLSDYKNQKLKEKFPQHNSNKQDNICLRRATTRKSLIKKPRLPSIKSKNAVTMYDEKEKNEQFVGILFKKIFGFEFLREG